MAKGKKKENKWSPVNPKHFEGKTLKELQKQLQKAEEFIKKYPEFKEGWHIQYRNELKKRIANEIGREK